MDENKVKAKYKRYRSLDAKLSDVPDSVLLKIYQTCPPMMSYIAASKGMLDEFFEEHDLRPGDEDSL